MGKSSTSFKKGHSIKKPVGTKSKKTILLENFAEYIVNGGMQKFETELNKLSGKQYVDAYMCLFEFVKPKLARTEIKADIINPNDIKIEIV